MGRVYANKGYDNVGMFSSFRVMGNLEGARPLELQLFRTNIMEEGEKDDVRYQQQK